MLVESDSELKALLQKVRTIAMVGASANPTRDSYGVFAYLQQAGYKVVPITPKNEPIHGITPFASLEEYVAAHGRPDLVDVFRAPEAAVDVAQKCLDLGIKRVWYQLGAQHPDATTILTQQQAHVVQDACIKIEHRRLLGPQA